MIIIQTLEKCLRMVQLKHIVLLQEVKSGFSGNRERIPGSDWQLGKTIHQCNKYMFESKMAANVIFKVCGDDGYQEVIWAHKYILLSRSPVFEAMLDPLWYPDDGKVPQFEITDIHATVFNELLR